MNGTVGTSRVPAVKRQLTQTDGGGGHVALRECLLTIDTSALDEEYATLHTNEKPL